MFWHVLAVMCKKERMLLEVGNRVRHEACINAVFEVMWSPWIEMSFCCSGFKQARRNLSDRYKTKHLL